MDDDLWRKRANAISEVVHNRPSPIREIDQIYMRSGDMILHCEWFSRLADGLDAVFVGDGDAVALGSLYLAKLGLVKGCPRSITVLDFDERIVDSINQFGKKHELDVKAKLYNVVSPLELEMIQAFDVFHINPPYGQRNVGASVRAFMMRGMEALKSDCGSGVAVIAHDQDHDWTSTILHAVQSYALGQGFTIEEFVPAFHRYHLDDNPELASCTMLMRKTMATNAKNGDGTSCELDLRDRKDFYGAGSDLEIKFVRKKRRSKEESYDYAFEYLDNQLDLSIR